MNIILIVMGSLVMLIGFADWARSRRKLSSESESDPRKDARRAVPLVVWFVAGAWFLVAGIALMFIDKG